MDFVSILIGIAVLPFQAINFVVTSVLELIFFDLFQLAVIFPMGI